MPGMRVPLPALAALLFTACASPLRRYEGVYHRAFEQHSLRPCTTSSPDRAWWIVMSPAADSVAAAAVARDPSAVLHARLRGRVSAPGAYGHLGAYERIFSVEHVEEIRPQREGDCVPSRR